MTQEHIETLKQIVEHGGGTWVGRQEAFDEDIAPAYVLFQAPISGRLLMLPDNEFFTVQAVCERVHLADKRYHNILNEFEESI